MRIQLLSVLSFSLLVCAEQMVFSNNNNESPLTTSQPTLADLLTIETSASIFYSYARETEMSRLFGMEGASNTLLVPTNKAVMALARKPHLGSAGLESDMDISEQEFDEISKKNVENWVSAHIIPASPIDISDRSYETLLEGKTVKFKTEGYNQDVPDWRHVVLEDGVHIIGMKQATNGVLYLIDGTVKLD